LRGTAEHVAAAPCPMSFQKEKETNERRGYPSSLERLQVALHTEPTFCPVFVPA